jgi:hypothetical protein
VLVVAALAICAITAAQLKDRTDTQAPPPARPDHPPADPGMSPLTVPEIARLLTAFTHPPSPPGHAGHWSVWNAVTKPSPAGTTNAHDSQNPVIAQLS